ncbi:MAG: AAA-like domain-containing protein [Blautia sp.]|nr:AAA-like domain-containing protein [Blautia sp.]
MRKSFNITGDCKPNLHYMVNIDSRLVQIKKMVDSGSYFTINRARQYGKTTTLRALSRFLTKDYLVASLDFQMMSASKFRNENTFSVTFARIFIEAIEADNPDISPELKDSFTTFKKDLREHKEEIELYELFQYLSRICDVSVKPVVLLIDEVDSASNNQVFLDFLAQLRGYYINRDVRATFQSVILAGVYDVKNMKHKIRPDDAHKQNSPWNIAVDFSVNMSFSVEDIAGMLTEYESDDQTGMKICEIAGLIYDYTSGYPFLVSHICKLIDEQIAGSDGYPDKKSAWTREGFQAAIKILLTENNTLFESMFRKLSDYPELKEMIYSILFCGKKISYNLHNPVIQIASMFGFVKNEDGAMVVANRIFETLLYNYFTSAEELNSQIFSAGTMDRNQFIQNGILNMEMILEKFVLHWGDLYSSEDDKFIEDNGRKLFLLYLKPIINGTGNYYIEARTRDNRRTDVIVDYRGKQYIIELKIWHGNAYNIRGEKQLSDYLDYYHLQKGYMLSFNFNKNKQPGVKEIRMDNKILVEAVV